MNPKYIVPQVADIWSEVGRFARMLRVEVANCEAWYEQGLIPLDEVEVIRDGAAINWRVYRSHLARTRHDTNSFVAAVAYEIDKLAKLRGLEVRPGRWIHYNMTSYDAWDTALAMQIRESVAILQTEINRLLAALKRRGMEHWNTVMIGRTHGMHAEPTTFGAKLANYYKEVWIHHLNLMEVDKFWKIAKISGPVGTHENVPATVEDAVARILGVRPIQIATQVIPRVWVLRYLNHLNELGGTIDKIATDIRDMQRPEICEVEEPFPAEAVGSSIMVHKRNAEVCERCCSLAREIAGTVTPARMNVVLWHERDLTNSANERTILLEANNLAVYITARMADVFEGLHVYPKRMLANLNLTAGIVRSGRVLNLLVERGMSRGKARKLIVAHTHAAWQIYKEGEPMPYLKDVLAQDPQISRYVSTEDLEQIFDPSYGRLLEGVKVSFRRLGWMA